MIMLKFFGSILHKSSLSYSKDDLFIVLEFGRDICLC